MPRAYTVRLYSAARFHYIYAAYINDELCAVHTAHTIRMIFIDRKGGAAGALCDSMSGVDYVARLQSELKQRYGKNTVAMSSADGALHTALHICGVRGGDYVFVPSYTFYTNISTVAHTGGIPVFIDCDPATRCVSELALDTAFLWAQLQNKLPKAVVIDNAFGAVADFDALMPLCKSYGVSVIELACDAFGGKYKGKPCGSNGDFGVISFCKRVSGGGGALVCGEGSDEARAFARIVYSDGENHDYRMHNAIAALDCALLDPADKITERAKANLEQLMKITECIAQPTDGDAATYAFVKCAKHAAKIKDDGFDVKTPPPVHTLPQYSDRPFFEHEQGYCVCGAYHNEYCLIGLDMSAGKRLKLGKRLRALCL